MLSTLLSSSHSPPPLPRKDGYHRQHSPHDTKEMFHAEMDKIKDRNGKELTEAERLRRGGQNTQKKYPKKVSMTQTNIT